MRLVPKIDGASQPMPICNSGTSLNSEVSNYIIFMMFFFRPIIIFVIFYLALLAAPLSYLQAEQTDMRLPALFEKLNATSDKATAEVIASQIWAIWSEHRDDERLSQKLSLGTEQMNAGNLHAAEKTFTNIINIDPTFAEAWNKRATVYFLMGAFAQSKEILPKPLFESHAISAPYLDWGW